jgi:hypothetical protein
LCRTGRTMFAVLRYRAKCAKIYCPDLAYENPITHHISYFISSAWLSQMQDTVPRETHCFSDRKLFEARNQSTFGLAVVTRLLHFLSLKIAEERVNYHTHTSIAFSWDITLFLTKCTWW